MRIVNWEVRYTSVPAVIRYCKKCNEKSEYYTKGMFRVNAQKQCMDIWLIYKCKDCDNTWNMSIKSRIHPQSISKQQLDKFFSNDLETAMYYATNAALIKNSGAEISEAAYEVIGPDVDLSEPVEIHISSKWLSEVKAASVLRNKLGVSRSTFERMLDRIHCVSGHDITKCKVAGEIVVQIN